MIQPAALLVDKFQILDRLQLHQHTEHGAAQGVSRQAVASRAAAGAPAIAATLPPPGVGALEPSASRNSRNGRSSIRPSLLPILARNQVRSSEFVRRWRRSWGRGEP